MTGGMGSGKTLAASMFRELGVRTIDADAICRDLVAPGEPAWKEIVDQFGEGVLAGDRTLDRQRMAGIVFSDPTQKKKLESILHPRVFEEEARIYDRLRKEDPRVIVIVNAALLIESGNFRNMDRVVVVRAEEKTQVDRVVKRGGMSRDDVLRRIRNQMSLEEKIKFADHVIDNTSSVDHLHAQVDQLFDLFKALA
ncbi:MAG: dephospho-CoA kinase [Nitrospinae bacterium CG11_big_fil_rev_8_21_14_0_20_56_8]|nr:MAG: dephospho-CoA kinase [Nitrospinae bacterium CG11_big_fil_rev_8_21_14_0_20_56_8]